MRKIKNCIKRFNQGMNKVVSPNETYQTALHKIRLLEEPILQKHYEVKKPSKIPQYRFMGTDYFTQYTTANGSNGKGHTHDQALASGIMELAERYSCYRYLNRKNAYTIRSFQLNRDSSNAFQLEDIYASCMNGVFENVPLKEEFMDARIRWYEASTLRGEQVWLPSMLTKFLFHGSNGMAAGNSLEEALLQGICEVIERHCKKLIFFNQLSVPTIDLSTIHDPICKKLISTFQNLGHKLNIMDFSLGLGVPVIGVTRVINETSCHFTAGVAASKYEALVRALTENSQVEGKHKRILLDEMTHLQKDSEMISMADIPHLESKNIKIELEAIENLLKKQNMRIFFHDTTDDALQIPAVIVFITGAKHFSENKFHQNLLYAILEDHLETERYDEAIQHIEKYQKKDRRNKIEYEYFKASTLHCNKEYSKAINSFKKVLNNTQNHTVNQLSLFKLGMCYQAEDKSDKAIDHFKEIYHHNPQLRIERLSLYGNMMRSNNHSLRNQFIEARLLYDEIIRKKEEFYFILRANATEEEKITLNDIVNYFKLTGQYIKASDDVIRRKVTIETAKKQGIKASSLDLQTIFDTFRVSNKLNSSLDTYKWLESNSMSVETLIKHLEEDLLISEFKENLYQKYISKT